ncbi:MAG: hypothetical protein KDB90_06705 [Planctomycetes bacterium]|nr:hypothetical protein [Planctomycetota bacterium]
MKVRSPVLVESIRIYFGVGVMLSLLVSGCAPSTAGNGLSPTPLCAAPASNVVAELPVEGEPTSSDSNWAIQYRVVHNESEVAELPPEIRMVWVVSAGDETVRSLVSRAELQISRLNLEDGAFTDESFRDIAQMSSLIHLNVLRCPRVTSVGVGTLKDLPQLRSISLLQCDGIGSDALKALRDTFDDAVMLRIE